MFAVKTATEIALERAAYDDDRPLQVLKMFADKGVVYWDGDRGHPLNYDAFCECIKRGWIHFYMRPDYDAQRWIMVPDLTELGLRVLKESE